MYVHSKEIVPWVAISLFYDNFCTYNVNVTIFMEDIIDYLSTYKKCTSIFCIIIMYEKAFLDIYVCPTIN